jgi:hypothetical protein
VPLASDILTQLILPGDRPAKVDKCQGRPIEDVAGSTSGLRLPSAVRLAAWLPGDPASDFFLLQGCGHALCMQSNGGLKAVAARQSPGPIRGPYPLMGFRRPSKADEPVTGTNSDPQARRGFHSVRASPTLQRI